MKNAQGRTSNLLFRLGTGRLTRDVTFPFVLGLRRIGLRIGLFIFVMSIFALCYALLGRTQNPHVAYAYTDCRGLPSAGNLQDRSFFSDVLGYMGIPVTPFALDAFMAWVPFEGTPACWNPLATTYHADWIGSDCTDTLYNGIGVRNYSSKSCGERATAYTLLYTTACGHDCYKPIRDMLSQTSFDWQSVHDAVKPWIGSEAYATDLTNKWQNLWNSRGGGGSDYATFITDVTIPDGTTLLPGQHFTKIWRMQNSGSTTWNGYTWAYVSGSQMGGPSSVAVASTSPNSMVDISVDMVAPSTAGSYTGYWQMKNSGGSLFGQSAWVKINVSGGSKPSTPASPNPSDGQTLGRTTDISLAWTTDGNQCDVHVWGGPGFNTTQIGQPCTSFHLGSQWPGTYQWQVTAYNNSGSASGPTWSFKIKPYAPTSATATAVSQTQIRVNWTKSTDDPGSVDNYKLYYSNGTPVTTLASGTTSYTVDGLSCGKSYSFYVTAIRQSVESDSSNWAGTFTQACGGSVPSVPSSPNPADGSTLSRTNDTTLYWNTDGTSCDIHIWGGAIDINPSGQSCSSLHLGSQYGGSYQWVVTAHNANGTTTGSVWHFGVQPYAPTNLSASAVSSSQINLTWTKSSDDPGSVDNYAIYYSNGTLIDTVSSGTSSRVVSGLSCSTSYSFYIKAIRQGISSDASNTAATPTAGCITPAPNPPTPLSPSAQSRFDEHVSSITFNWSGEGNEFLVEWCGPECVNSGWITSHSYTPSTLCPSCSIPFPTGSYLWHVKARNSGGESAWTGTPTFTIRPSAPTQLKVDSVSCSQVHLSWQNNSALANTFNIHQSGGSGYATQSSTSFTASVSEKTTYVFWVTAAVYVLESDPSNQVVVTTPACPDTTPPTGSVTSPANNSVTNNPNFTITANASDAGSGVNKVEFHAAYDGYWHLICIDTDAPYSCSWSANGIGDQNITFTIHVTDNAGNEIMDPGGYHIVTLDQTKPSGYIMSPMNSDVVTACPASIGAYASDSSSGVAWVRFWAWYDGSWHEIATDTNGNDGWSAVWNCASISPQTVTLTTWMGDNAGNQAVDPGGYVYVTIPVRKPDLVPYTGTGFPAPVVVSSIQGTHAMNTLYAGATTYFDWYFINNGYAWTSNVFNIEVWVDNQRIVNNQYYLVGPGSVIGVDDMAVTITSPGTHVVKLVLDPANTIDESDETNNVWQYTFTWQPINGWKGEYFNNSNLAGTPWLTRDEAAIDFDWYGNAPDPSLPADQFSARWARTVNFVAGTYRFYIYHDDGGRLFIDGNKVFENWCGNCSLTETVDVPITAGNHAVVMEMAETGGWAGARLTWENLDACYYFNFAALPRGSGGILVSPPDNCSNGVGYIKGTVVTMTAYPQAGYQIQSWTGCDNSSGSQCTLVMQSIKDVVANFAPIPAAQPVNDYFGNAILIPAALPYNFTQDPTGATLSADDPNLCTGLTETPGSGTVWYKFKPTQSGYANFNTLGSNYDTVLAVFTGVQGNLTRLACNDDISSTRQSEVRMQVIANTTYYVDIADWITTTHSPVKPQTAQRALAPNTNKSLSISVTWGPDTPKIYLPFIRR